MKDIALVAAGGAIGSVFRYLVQRFFLGLQLSYFPFGTFTVNVLGCLLIGLLMGMKGRSELSLFLMTGVCGGFTTFSAFSAESIALVNSERYLGFIGYVSASIILGISATMLGHHLTK